MRVFLFAPPWGQFWFCTRTSAYKSQQKTQKGHKYQDSWISMNELFCIFYELFDLFLYLFIFHIICAVTANVGCLKVPNLKIRIIILLRTSQYNLEQTYPWWPKKQSSRCDFILEKKSTLQYLPSRICLTTPI